MRSEKFKTIVLFVLVFGFFLGSVLYTSDILKAADPSGVHVTVFQTDLLASSSSTPVTIFTNTSGVTVDIVGNPNTAFGSGTVNAGTYKRIHFKVQNKITWDGPNPCGGADLTNQTLRIDETKLDTAQVDLFFATADDGGSSGWTANGTQSYPFLLQTPITVQGSATTVVKLIFLTAGTVQCIGGTTAELLPPDMSTVTYVKQTAVSGGGCNFNQDQTFWFVHYNVNSWIKEYLISKGTPTAVPTEDEILSNTGVNVGWGTVTFAALNSSGTGTWSVDPRYKASDYPQRGMTEHRHRLRGWDPTNKPDEGLNDPADNSAPGPMGGQYTVAGQKIIMYFPEGGHAEGAVSPDCNTFVGANISTTSENDLIFAVKKSAISMSGTGFPAGKYQIISNALDITYDKTTIVSPWSSSTGTAYSTGWISFQPQTMYFDTTAYSGSGGQFNWKPHYPLSRSWGRTTGSWTSTGPEERVEWSTTFNTDLASSVTGTDGLLSFPTDTTFDAFIAFNDHGNGVFGGSIVEEDLRWSDATHSQHYLQGGFIVKTATSPVPSDLVGKWVIGVLESRLESGTTDTAWGSGDETAQFGLTYGDVTIDSGYNVTLNFTHKDAFSGTVSSETGTGGTIESHDECYAYDTANRVGAPITATGASCAIPGTATPGIVNKVFYVRAGGRTEAKIVLNADKNTIVIFKPVDSNDTPNGAPEGIQCVQSPSTDPNWCGDAANNFVVGVGVKIQ